MNKKSWEQFRETGLLWLINVTLHLFGWAIVCEVSEDKVISVYPARVTYRGFTEQDNTEGYRKVTKYLSNSINDLEKEINDEN